MGSDGCRLIVFVEDPSHVECERIRFEILLDVDGVEDVKIVHGGKD